MFYKFFQVNLMHKDKWDDKIYQKRMIKCTILPQPQGYTGIGSAVIPHFSMK
uniref:Uncharacterized protein n=1 Tax=Ciona intestinalis TaxID=7719 RepID=H2Y3G7_CIOIN